MSYGFTSAGTRAAQFIYVHVTIWRCGWFEWAIEMLGSRALCFYKRAVLTRYWRQWGGLLLTRLPLRAPLSTSPIPMLDIKPPSARCALLLWNPIKLRAPRRTHWSRFANEPQVGDYIRGSANRLFCDLIGYASRCSFLKEPRYRRASFKSDSRGYDDSFGDGLSNYYNEYQVCIELSKRK